MTETRSVYNAGIDVDLLRTESPSGIENALSQLMNAHVGRTKAIGRQDLLRRLRAWPYSLDVSDRQLRLAVNSLRKDGTPICSTGGINGGYWLAESRKELEEYIDNEIRSRLADLREQELALIRAARKHFGDQYSLGI